MKHLEKERYDTPTIEVVEMQIEWGFAQSLPGALSDPFTENEGVWD